MYQIDPELSIGQIVAENPGLAPVFEKHSIDYCCGGGTPLVRACAERNLSLSSLLAELEETGKASDNGETDWTGAGLGDLADHIVATHHRYLKEELPRLAYLVEKVETAHGDSHPELHELRATFDHLRSEFDAHMVKEETVLFPLCKQIEQSRVRPKFHCGSIDNPIGVMESEHAAQARDLERMRELTNHYTLPGDGCNTYRVMLDSLARLETDTHQHVHLENNSLFPRASALSRALPESESGVDESHPDRLREHPSERIAVNELPVDLIAAAGDLRREPHAATHGHRQKSLFRHGPVTVTLFVFDRGGRLERHIVPEGTVSIHVLNGALTVETEKQTHQLAGDNVLLLAPGVAHSVTARESSRMLLTVCLEAIREHR